MRFIQCNEDLMIDRMSLSEDFDVMEYDDMFSDELDTPQPGANSGVAQIIIDLINDEWEAITGYNTAIEHLRVMMEEGSISKQAQGVVDVLRDIANEENLHVGQLQEALQIFSPNARYIDKGKEESKEQLGAIDATSMIQGIQFWDEKGPKQLRGSRDSNDDVSNPNQVDTICSLCDVDDDF